MRKINKEDIYINLQGKSEEELTELYNFLESVGEKIYRRLSYFLRYSENCKPNCYLSFSLNQDEMTWNNSEFENKQEVTIQQLKEILQPMESKEEQLRKEAIERGFVNGVKFYGSQGAEATEPMLINDNVKYMPKEEESDIFGLYVNNSWLCFNGKWGTLVEETLEQQLEKAKAEVKRLEDEIEDSKVKVGDLVCYTSIHNKKVMLFGYCEDIKDNNIYIGGLNYEDKQCKKITDKELINKLNNLIK